MGKKSRCLYRHSELSWHNTCSHITKPDPVRSVFGDCVVLSCPSSFADARRICFRVVWSSPIRRPELWRSSTRWCCTASSSWWVTWSSVYTVQHSSCCPAVLSVVCVCEIRCCIKSPGVRVSVGTVLHFVQRSECFYFVRVSWMTFDLSFWFWTTVFTSIMFNACVFWFTHTLFLPLSSHRYSDHLHRFHEDGGDTWQ